jgi:rare lipoprotein A
MAGYSLKTLVFAATLLSSSICIPMIASAQSGIASVYSEGSHTASGERLVPSALTAAHRTLPFGTMLRVSALSTGRSTIVKVNDRGPAASTGRALDLSRGAAVALGIAGQGEAKVAIEIVH